MPIYDPRRKVGRLPTTFRRGVDSKGRPQSEIMERYWGWPIEFTKFTKIRRTFQRIFGKDDFLLKRFDATGKKQILLDWGCGGGAMVREATSFYGNRATVLGYSVDSYKEWDKIKNVKFIQCDSNDLDRYLRLGNIRPDCIVSHLGLSHLLGESDKPKHMAQLEKFRKLYECMQDGGVMAFNIPNARIRNFLLRLTSWIKPVGYLWTEETLMGQFKELLPDAKISLERRVVYIKKPER
ncbi:MAG: class I SAM-dependent methyltransferase [Candidatus Diapherotrites archaeon]|uniref:Class I SAM-dependent methyltransferase n=1 Tax=Candidatus Iainarchaeum sp. TaxID=3101447 RepID=A0A8T3YN31_9ARCH|nr:class I SAM-dependent methyltransferase [Candidatus Diapherotrites archaeon]